MIEGSETEDIVVVVFIRYTRRRPRARSISCGAPNPTLDQDVQSLENQIRNAAASPIAYFPPIQKTVDMK